MSYSSCKIAELISTRMSHDLAGGIGSLYNLIDCLEVGEPLDAEDKNILDKTAKDLRARQKFLRIAFGVSTKSFSAEEIEKLCSDYLVSVGSQSRNISLNLKNTVPELAKYLCLCVLTAVEVAIKDAIIEIDVNKDNILINIAAESKLSEDKINAYKHILAEQDIEETEALQVVQLIYLREILGKDVPISINTTDEKSAIFVIG